MTRNKNIRHIVALVSRYWFYFKSKDFKKREFFANDLDILRIQAHAKKLNESWTYEPDTFLGVKTDHIKPPMVASLEYDGDCDDYASALVGRYVDTNNIYVVSLHGKDKQLHHAVTAIKVNDLIFTINWGKTYVVHTVDELVELYEQLYDTKIYSCIFARWNQKKHKYVVVRKIG